LSDQQTAASNVEHRSRSTISRYDSASPTSRLTSVANRASSSTLLANQAVHRHDLGQTALRHNPAAYIQTQQEYMHLETAIDAPGAQSLLPTRDRVTQYLMGLPGIERFQTLADSPYHQHKSDFAVQPPPNNSLVASTTPHKAPCSTCSTRDPHSSTNGDPDPQDPFQGYLQSSGTVEDPAGWGKGLAGVGTQFELQEYPEYGRPLRVNSSI
jgi:hypothetical protein